MLTITPTRPLNGARINMKALLDAVWHPPIVGLSKVGAWVTSASSQAVLGSNYMGVDINEINDLPRPLPRRC